MTFALVFGSLSLLCLLGLGPTLLLFPRPDSTRVLLSPFIGLSSSVLLFFLLLPLNLNGLQTAAAEILLLALLAVVGCIRSPVQIRELRDCLHPFLICLAACFLFGWPLFLSGYDKYAGFGNPDVAYFLTVLKYFSNHPVSTPDPEFFRGLSPGGILGVFATAYQISFVSRVVVTSLFSIVCTIVVCLVPASAYLLCRLGLNTDRATSLLVAWIAATSSLAAYHYYLHSLGTLTVMVLLPATMAAALAYFRTSQPRYAVLFGLLLATGLYNYGQGLGIFLVVSGALAVWHTCTRRISVRSAGILAACVTCAVAIPSFPYVVSVLQMVQHTAAGGHLDAASDEAQTSFALLLTERGIPYFWGLYYPWAPAPSWLGDQRTAISILICLSCCITLLCGWFVVRGSSRLSKPFCFTVGCVVAVVAFYYSKGVAYGVFKLAAWVNVLLIVAFAAGAIDAAAKFRPLAGRIVAWTALIVFAGFNLSEVIRLGRFSVGLDGASLNVLRGMRVEDFKSLERLPHKKTLVGLSDVAVRAWAAPFLGEATYLFPDDTRKAPQLMEPTFRFLGAIGYRTQDSTPLSFLPGCKGQIRDRKIPELNVSCNDIDAQYLLALSTGSDLGTDSYPAVWTSGSFALHSPIPSTFVVLGRGWYRSEKDPKSPVPWQRRVFRWMRKRAEFFVLHPTRIDKRLHLLVASGFTNQSQPRHIGVVLNGEIIETVRVDGFRELYTSSFHVPGPLSQIELAVEEDVRPISRSLALWNKWVPEDARLLNVAVAELELVDTGGEETHIPTSVNFTDAEWTTTNGIFPDRWLGTEAEVELQVPPDPQQIVLRGFVPQVHTYRFPMPVEVLIGGHLLGNIKIGRPGDFELRIPIGSDALASLVKATNITVTLRPAQSFVPSVLGTSNDLRRLSFQIRYLGFESADNSAAVGGRSGHTEATSRAVGRSGVPGVVAGKPFGGLGAASDRTT
jgi:hypothetical protein